MKKVFLFLLLVSGLIGVYAQADLSEVPGAEAERAEGVSTGGSQECNDPFGRCTSKYDDSQLGYNSMADQQRVSRSLGNKGRGGGQSGSSSPVNE